LKREDSSSFRSIRWSEKNRSVGRIFFEHALLVSDVMVALELGCRGTNGASLLTDDSMPSLGDGSGPRSIKWHVQLSRHVSLASSLITYLHWRSPTRPARSSVPFYFLEVDRGTMPVVRKNLTQSSFYRKLLAYGATWSQSIHRTLFGFHRFRVLTVTTSAARVKSLIDACSQLKSGHGLFLFLDQATLEKHGDVLTVQWQTGRQGETSTLLP